MPAWALGQRQLLLVPNVNQSGKSHHPPALGDRCSESGVPNVNRSGKSHHALINAWLGKVSRTSTNRASPITRLQAPQPRFMKRPERQPFGQAPSRSTNREHVAWLGVPSVNRSGKYHHTDVQTGERGLPASRTSTVRASPITRALRVRRGATVRPERQPIGQVPSPSCLALAGRPEHQPLGQVPSPWPGSALHVLDKVPNINRSGKSHHPNAL
jgi:hypothetical protein